MFNLLIYVVERVIFMEKFIRFYRQTDHLYNIFVPETNPGQPIFMPGN